MVKLTIYNSTSVASLGASTSGSFRTNNTTKRSGSDEGDDMDEYGNSGDNQQPFESETKSAQAEKETTSNNSKSDENEVNDDQKAVDDEGQEGPNEEAPSLENEDDFDDDFDWDNDNLDLDQNQNQFDRNFDLNSQQQTSLIR